MQMKSSWWVLSLFPGFVPNETIQEYIYVYFNRFRTFEGKYIFCYFLLYKIPREMWLDRSALHIVTKTPLYEADKDNQDEGLDWGGEGEESLSI